MKELPAPAPGKSGWPWVEETAQLLDTMPDRSSWPKISIVTISYNAVRFIEETIRSILLQGYPDLEYIVIDGASNDGTVDIIRRYEPWLSYWVSEKDRGPSPAFNKGLLRCTGDIITFFSSDDIYLKGTFGDVASKWPKLREYGVVVGGFYYIDVHSKPSSEIIPPRLPNQGPIDLTLIPLDEWRLHQEATFYTREALDNVGRYVREDLHYHGDRELLYRICRSNKVLLVQRAYSAFRRHAGSNTTACANRFPAALEYAKLHFSYCLSGDKDYKRRKQIAKHRMAKAYITDAKYNANRMRSAIALLQAIFYRPSLMTKVTYFAIWLKVLKIAPLIKYLRKKYFLFKPRQKP